MWYLTFWRTVSSPQDPETTSLSGREIVVTGTYIYFVNHTCGNWWSGLVISCFKECVHFYSHVYLLKNDFHLCHSFFIVIRGTVSIYINSAIAEEEDETKIAQHARLEDLFPVKGFLDRSKLGNFIGVIGNNTNSLS